MTDTGQEEVDPESKQYKIDNQDWTKSKVYSPQRDEDKTPPRGRGRGWRTRAKGSPTPGNKQVDKDTSRGQRSSGHAKKDDALEDDRRNEEAEMRMQQQEERRREDERRWEEDRGWKGGGKKEAPPRQPVGDGTAETRTTEKSRKPRRAAQEIYVLRAKRREAQQLYVPRARREAESAKSASAEKDPPRTVNPREPPEKKRIVANQTQQRGARTHEEIKSRKSSGRTEELRHKSDKYLESKEERRSSTGRKPDRTGDSSRSSESRRNRGRDSDKAAKRQSASKHSKQVPSYSSPKSRSEDTEVALDDSNTGGRLVDPEYNSALINLEHGADVNEISMKDKHESEDRVITEPQGNLDDQVDAEIKSDVQKYDNSSEYISGSTVEQVCSVSESPAQGNSAISEVEPNEMPNVVGSEVSSNVTDSQMIATIDEYNKGASDMPDQSCEIEQTMSPNANHDAEPSSPQTNMAVFEEIVQAQRLVLEDDQRSCDEGVKDISAVGVDKGDVKEESIMEVEDNRVMEGEGEAESGKIKVDVDNSKSHSQPDTTPELCTMDEMVKAGCDIEEESIVFIDSNDKLPEELNNDAAGSGESGTKMAADIENGEKRTSREHDNVSQEPISAGEVQERTGDSDSVEKELEGKEIPTVPDVTDTVANDIDAQVVDKESVDVKDTNTSVSTAINDADNDDVIAVDQEQDQEKSKQMEVFKDALLTHTGSEDYGSSSSDAAYADVEKSSTSSREDAMDTEEDAGGDGDGDGGVVDEDSWDALFDDTGTSLKPEEEEELAKGIGKVKVSLKKRKHDYYNWQPKDNMDYSAYEHVIEVYDFPSEFKTPDLIMAFSDFKNKGFDIKWVDDTHALAIFATPLVAQDALGLLNPMFRTRPLALATRESKMKAKRSIEFLKPFKPKPDTTAVAARRLISGALGIKTKVTREQREAERRKLREAKDKKRADKQQTNDIWEGNV